LGSLTSLTWVTLADNDLSGLVPLGFATVAVNASVCNLRNNPDLYVPDTPEYTALGSDICGVPFSPPEAVVVNVMGQIADMVSDGALSKGEGNSLTVKLATALKKMQRGQYHVAVNVLYAFIEHVDDFTAAGKLDGQQSVSLIHQANILIEQCTARL
jgi:hypothetical protein